MSLRDWAGEWVTSYQEARDQAAEENARLKAADRQQRRTRPSAARIILIVLLVLAVVHEAGVFSSRSNPPVACQIMGGQWNVLTGWHCG